MEDAFSTFQIAKICRVTPRTVANWIDDSLIKSFKTPGNYRKVLKSDLIEFLNKNGMPQDGLHETSTRRVLIIDSDEAVLKLAKKAIQTRFPQIEVENGKEAQEALVKIAIFRPDIIIIDEKMAKIDVLALQAQLDAAKMDRNIEFVITSDRFSPKSKEEYKKRKLRFLLEKPVDAETFLKVISRSL